MNSLKECKITYSTPSCNIYKEFKFSESSQETIHNFKKTKAYTVSAADDGGMNSVNPPSIQSRFRNIVAGLGAKYLK